MLKSGGDPGGGWQGKLLKRKIPSLMKKALLRINEEGLQKIPAASYSPVPLPG
jgi:hypothetical protein